MADAKSEIIAEPDAQRAALADKVIQFVIEGLSLRAACRETNVANREFYTWIHRDDALRDRYQKACEFRWECQVAQLADADEEVAQLLVTAKELGIPIDAHSISAMTGVAKLKSDNVKWIAARMRPRKYAAPRAVDPLASDSNEALAPANYTLHEDVGAPPMPEFGDTADPQV